MFQFGLCTHAPTNGAGSAARRPAHPLWRPIPMLGRVTPSRGLTRCQANRVLDKGLHVTSFQNGEHAAQDVSSLRNGTHLPQHMSDSQIGEHGQDSSNSHSGNQAARTIISSHNGISDAGHEGEAMTGSKGEGDGTQRGNMISGTLSNRGAGANDHAGPVYGNGVQRGDVVPQSASAGGQVMIGSEQAGNGAYRSGASPQSVHAPQNESPGGERHGTAGQEVEDGEAATQNTGQVITGSGAAGSNGTQKGKSASQNVGKTRQVAKGARGLGKAEQNGRDGVHAKRGQAEKPGGSGVGGNGEGKAGRWFPNRNNEGYAGKRSNGKPAANRSSENPGGTRDPRAKMLNLRIMNAARAAQSAENPAEEFATVGLGVLTRAIRHINPVHISTAFHRLATLSGTTATAREPSVAEVRLKRFLLKAAIEQGPAFGPGAVAQTLWAAVQLGLLFPPTLSSESAHGSAHGSHEGTLGRAPTLSSDSAHGSAHGSLEGTPERTPSDRGFPRGGRPGEGFPRDRAPETLDQLVEGLELRDEVVSRKPLDTSSETPEDLTEGLHSAVASSDPKDGSISNPSEAASLASPPSDEMGGKIDPGSALPRNRTHASSAAAAGPNAPQEAQTAAETSHASANNTTRSDAIPDLKSARVPMREDALNERTSAPSPKLPSLGPGLPLRVPVVSGVAEAPATLDPERGTSTLDPARETSTLGVPRKKTLGSPGTGVASEPARNDTLVSPGIGVAPKPARPQTLTNEEEVLAEGPDRAVVDEEGRETYLHGGGEGSHRGTQTFPDAETPGPRGEPRLPDLDDLFRAVLPSTRTAFDSFSTLELGMVGWAIGKAGYAGPAPILDAYADAFEAKLGDATPQSVTMCLMGLTSVRHFPPALLEASFQHMAARLGEYTPQAVGNLAWVWAVFDYPPSADLAARIRGHYLEMIRQKDAVPRTTATFLWAMATLGHLTPDYLQQVIAARPTFQINGWMSSARCLNQLWSADRLAAYSSGLHHYPESSLPRFLFAQACEARRARSLQHSRFLQLQREIAACARRSPLFATVEPDSATAGGLISIDVAATLTDPNVAPLAIMADDPVLFSSNAGLGFGAPPLAPRTHTVQMRCISTAPPSASSSASPSAAPSGSPSEALSGSSSAELSASPSASPSATLSGSPSAPPSGSPSASSPASLSASPSAGPRDAPTESRDGSVALTAGLGFAEQAGEELGSGASAEGPGSAKPQAEGLGSAKPQRRRLGWAAGRDRLLVGSGWVPVGVDSEEWETLCGDSRAQDAYLARRVQESLAKWKGVAR